MSRARPLAPEERRAAIVDATKPLLLEFGPELSTRQIAEAAGIAEGTLFRAFPSKDAILQETIRAALDPAATIERLKAIDPTLGLEARLRAVAEIVAENVTRASQLLSALFRTTSATPVHRGRGNYGAQLRTDRERLRTAIVAVLEPDADRLLLDVADAASFVNTLCFAAAHPLMSDGRFSDPDTLALLMTNALVKDRM